MSAMSDEFDEKLGVGRDGDTLYIRFYETPSGDFEAVTQRIKAMVDEHYGDDITADVGICDGDSGVTADGEKIADAWCEGSARR